MEINRNATGAIPKPNRPLRQPSAQEAKQQSFAPLSQEQAALIADLRNNSGEAWLTIKSQFKPMAVGAARFLAVRTRIPVEELAEAAEHGVMLAIADMRKPTYNPALEPLEQVVGRAISKEVQALVKVRRPDLSLDENWGDEGGHFNPFTPLVTDPLSDFDSASVGTARHDDDTLHEALEVVREALPALSLLSEWAIKTDVGLDGAPQLSDRQLADRLNLQPRDVTNLRRQARTKIKKRAAYARLPRSERLGKSIPYPHLKALDRLVKDQAALAPVLESAWGIFSQQEQNVLSLLVLFKLTPRQTAKALDTTYSAVTHLSLGIQKKLQDYFLLQSVNPKLLQAEEGNAQTAPVASTAESELLLKQAALKFKLSGLTETHLNQLTFFERELLKATVRDHSGGGNRTDEQIAAAIGLSADRYLKILGVMEERLRQLVGQGATQFTETRQGPLGVVSQQLSTMSDLERALLKGYLVEGLKPRQLVRTAREAGVKLSGQQAHCQAVQLVDSLKATLLKPARKPASPASEALQEIPIFDEQQLCEALAKEGVQGVTPEMLQSQLTEFQLDILKRRLSGMSYLAIAKALDRHESPVKHSAKGAVQKLKKAVAGEYLLPQLTQQGLQSLTEDQYRTLPPHNHCLLKHYFAYRHSLARVLQSIDQNTPAQEQVAELSRQLDATVEKLPPKQREILTDLLNKNVSFSELARQRGTELTLITSTVKAALGNLEKLLNPLRLENWLNDQGLTGVAEQDLSLLSETQRRLLLHYAQREYYLDATVAKIDRSQPAAQQVSQLREHLESALEALPPQAQEMLQAYCDGNYQPESLQRFFPDMALKVILRDRFSPVMQKLFKSLGTTDIGTRLRLRGFSFIDSSALRAIPQESSQILTLYLHYGKSLEPLASRVRRVSLTQEEAVSLIVEEVHRGVAQLTDHQHKVLSAYCEHRFNSGPVAKSFGCSHNSVLAALRLAMQKLESTMGEDGVRVRLLSQGVSNLTQADLETLPPAEQRLLDLYLKNDYSLVPLLRQLESQIPSATPKEKLTAISQALVSTRESLSSPHQKNALTLFCETPRSYGEIAEALGIGKQHSNRIGPLIQAGLENLRKTLESV